MTSALTWAVMHAQLRGTAHPAALAENPPPDFSEPNNPALVSARAELEKTFHERLEASSPC